MFDQQVFRSKLIAMMSLIALMTLLMMMGGGVHGAEGMSRIGCRCVSSQAGGTYCGAELVGQCVPWHLYRCEKFLWFVRAVDQGRCPQTCIFDYGSSHCSTKNSATSPKVRNHVVHDESSPASLGGTLLVGPPEADDSDTRWFDD